MLTGLTDNEHNAIYGNQSKRLIEECLKSQLGRSNFPSVLRRKALWLGEETFAIPLLSVHQTSIASKTFANLVRRAEQKRLFSIMQRDFRTFIVVTNDVLY